MEPRKEKQSIVSRLFGFGRKREEEPAPDTEPRGFAATEPGGDPGSDDESPSITVPEQVIRIRTGGARKKDEVINAIGDSFQELNRLLGSVSDRLDRQDTRAADLSGQLAELPEYLRQLPELHAEQNRIAQQTAESIALIPELQREFAEMQRLQSEEHRVAVQALGEAQQQTARVIHHGNQKQLQLFHQATQKTLQTVYQSTKAQRREMEQVLRLTEQNMRRMLILAGAFVTAAFVSVAAFLWFG